MSGAEVSLQSIEEKEDIESAARDGVQQGASTVGSSVKGSTMLGTEGDDSCDEDGQSSRKPLTLVKARSLARSQSKTPKRQSPVVLKLPHKQPKQLISKPGEANSDVVASAVVSKTRDHDKGIADTEEHAPTQDNWCLTNFRGKYEHSLGLANGVVDSGGTLPSCFRMLKSVNQTAVMDRARESKGATLNTHGALKDNPLQSQKFLRTCDIRYQLAMSATPIGNCHLDPQISENVRIYR